ncbi:hypothetical protein KCP76_09660 [Salmonella enterica subsp. enterica serovar Weltevreden]|nr:hypothetical protein KCP76_09660 [Salmonella enterica subsp. enterica serovar Weltevreden]
MALRLSALRFHRRPDVVGRIRASGRGNVKTRLMERVIYGCNQARF